MFWVFLFIILGIIVSVVVDLFVAKNYFISIIIIEFCLFCGLIIGFLYPIPANQCIENSKFYKLADISQDYKISKIINLYVEHDKKTNKINYQFLVEDLDQKPNYGEIKIQENKYYRTPIIEIYSYKKTLLASFWSLNPAVDNLNHSTIYISPKNIYSKEKD